MQSTPTKIGVVIPCYRVARFVRCTLESLIAQELTSWEAVIIDDGSPDDILSQIQDLFINEPRLRYFRKDNGGVASARNFGFRKLSKDVDFLMFLDGDDALYPFTLRVLVQELLQYPEAGMVHCEPDFIDEFGHPLPDKTWLPRWSFGPRKLNPDERTTPFESVYTLAGIIPSLSMFRRCIYDQTSGFDETFGHLYEDTDMNLQIALLSPIRYLPEKLVKYRIRDTQVSANQEQHRLQEKKLYLKWRTMSGLTKEQQAMIECAAAFRNGELNTHRGFLEAQRYYREKNWIKAFRFLQGALRRKIASCFYKARHENRFYL